MSITETIAMDALLVGQFFFYTKTEKIDLKNPNSDKFWPQTTKMLTRFCKVIRIKVS